MYNDLLQDDRFIQLLRLTSERGVLRAEFDALEMPGHMQPGEVWDALARIRHAQAIQLKDTLTVNGKPVAQWYSPTHAIENKLRDLAARTCLGSRLDVALRERYGRRFVVKSLVEEAVAAAACDGLVVDYETARGITVGERVPTTPAERIVANLYGLLDEVMEAGEFEISPAGIRRLYELLTEGVEVDRFSLGGGVFHGTLDGPKTPCHPSRRSRRCAALRRGRWWIPTSTQSLWGSA